MQIDENILMVVGEIRMPLMDLPRRMSVLRIAEQARPWHGTPSQGPYPAAKVVLAFDEAEREAESVTAVGGIVGAAAGSMAVPRARH